MSPFRIGAPGEELFGVLHEGAERAPLAVLVCNPFGQEAIRAHRVLRVIAERLARAGVPTLRFDYHGTGDSAGDDDAVTLARWRRDVGFADGVLRERTGCARVGWLGLRLGATIAALASADAPSPPDRLIAWDPVFVGADYLAELAQAHRAGIARAFPLPVAEPAASRPDDTEAMGYPLPRTFRTELAAIDRDAFASLRARRVAWLLPDGVAPPATPSAEPAVARVGIVDWATDEALNTSIVPADVVSAVIREATAP